MTEPLVPSHTEAAKDFCRILGVDPDTVQDITIEMPAGWLMRYQVSGFVTVKQLEGISNTLRRYALMPRKPTT